MLLNKSIAKSWYLETIFIDLVWSFDKSVLFKLSINFFLNHINLSFNNTDDAVYDSEYLVSLNFIKNLLYRCWRRITKQLLKWWGRIESSNITKLKKGLEQDSWWRIQLSSNDPTIFCCSFKNGPLLSKEVSRRLLK